MTYFSFEGDTSLLVEMSHFYMLYTILVIFFMNLNTAQRIIYMAALFQFTYSIPSSSHLAILEKSILRLPSYILTGTGWSNPYITG